MPLTVENRQQPVAVASAFGRIFYGAPNRVYFSQVYNDDLASLAKCYQRNDPTDTENPDLLANDGGELFIQGAGSIRAMKEFWKGILIFAERGVWFLSGGETNFSALSYRVEKISDARIISVRSGVSLEGAVFCLSETGIIRIAINESGHIQADNITELTINSWYENFIRPSPASSEERPGESILGTVDLAKKEILWFHPLTNEGVIYNIRAQAFYPQLYNLDPSESTSFIFNKELGFTHTTLIQEFDNDSQAYIYSLRYGCLDCAEFEDYGESFDSYLVTNFNTVGNFARKKSIPIMSVFFNKTETSVDVDNEGNYVFDNPSACTLQVLWDWNSSDAGGRLTTPRSIYNPMPKRRGFLKQAEGEESFDTGETVIEFKDKIRGKGRAVQFRLEAEEGKDMQLLGYNVTFSAKGRT